MMKNPFIYLVVGLILGAVVMRATTPTKQIPSPSEPATSTTGHDMSAMHHDTSMTMDDMTNMLKGKTGDEFDRAFLEGMIEHHQGAVDMANEAKKNAKHDEIKSMADDIIETQTKEITDMKEWQTTWGYTK